MKLCSKSSPQVEKHISPPKKMPENSPNRDSIPTLSPFRGFPLENIHESQYTGDTFDLLLDKTLQKPFPTRNLRTYTNRRKVRAPTPEIIQFHDCRNRDRIVAWLESTENRFERLTQSQNVDFAPPAPESCEFWSVSQKISPAKAPKVRKRAKSPPRVRTRSLNIHVTKNGAPKPIQRHSLAGDTPSLENYKIEEVQSSVGDGRIDENAKLVVDLREELFLEHLEHLNVDKKAQSGWERMNETLSGNRKRPKKLKIEKKNGKLIDSKVSIKKIDTSDTLKKNIGDKLLNILKTNTQNIVDKDEMLQKSPQIVLNKCVETSIPKNIRKSNRVSKKVTRFIDDFDSGKPLKTTPRSKSFKNTSKSDSIESSIEMAKTLIDSIENLSDSERFHELLPYISRLSQFGYSKLLIDSTSQTDCQINRDKPTQTEKIAKNSVETQTIIIEENRLIDTTCKNNIKPCTEKESNETAPDSIDLSPVSRNQLINTIIFKMNQCIEKEMQEIAVNTSDSSHGTNRLIEAKSDNLNKHIEKEKEVDNNNLSNRLIDISDGDNQSIEEESQKLVLDGDDLLPKSNRLSHSNDILRQSNDILPISAKNESVAITDSEKMLLEIDIEPINENIAAKPMDTRESQIIVSIPSAKPDLKRARSKSPEPEAKRPCNKFINDVSIVFDCNTEESVKPEMKLIQDSADILNENFFNDILDQYEPKKAKPEPAPVKDVKKTTQELIDHCDMLIYNATIKKRSIVEPERESIVANKARDSDYFETDTPSSNSRKELFPCVKKCEILDELSESMFSPSGESNEGDIERVLRLDDETVLKDRKNVQKINIIENILVQKSRIQPNDEDEDDIIESTPEKTYNSTDLHTVLPPPLEFQNGDIDANLTQISTISSPSTTPKNKSLRITNTRTKVTSTPFSAPYNSEKISVSPIMPFDQTRQNLLKTTPLHIIKKATTSSTPKTSKKQHSIIDYFGNRSQSSSATPSSPRIPCVTGTRLSKLEIIGIHTLAHKKLVKYSSNFSNRVTHLIVNVNDKNRVKDHTIKFVSAVASGLWVLNYEWIKAALAQNRLVDEEPFEVSDISGQPGPKMARMKRLSEPLFRNFKIYAAAPFQTSTKEEIERIVKVLGGCVVATPDDLLDSDGRIRVIVAEAQSTQDFEIYNSWMEVLKIVTLDIEWLSRSVGEYKVQKFGEFTLCSDELIETLDYPAELLL